MDFRVLGSLRVMCDGVPVEVGSAPKVRLVLAALLARGDRRASLGWLETVVWGEDPPRSARRNLQLYVYQLRRVLGAETIDGHPDGYTLVTGGDSDAQRFERLAAEGRRAGDDAAAMELFRRALDAWDGPAFAEFLDSAPIAAEAARLEQERQSCVELWAEAGLRLGRAREVVAELTELTDAQPHREAAVGLQLVALHRTGRRDEALETYQRFRKRLADDLGLDPGPALVRLHEAILGGDRTVRWPIAAPPPPAPVTPGGPYRGLVAYQAVHREWFFGRQRLTDRLLELVEAHRLVGVSGASGSGKSSLLRAGLIPHAPGILLTPDKRPLLSLALALEQLTGLEPERLAKVLRERPGELAGRLSGRPLIVVDQLEEIYTLCPDVGERTAFLSALLGLGDSARVVLGVRADFLARLSERHDVVDALNTAHLIVGPPSPDELREMICGPAERAGLAVEPALVATVLAEAGREPGALPLLSHALRETWRRRDGDDLTLAAYREAGGVSGAITETAERVHDGFDAQGRRAARLVFLR
ncbi:AfsR/SARP family transcriptional regulator, partial [Actinocorallia lasiicapitis]